MRSVSFVILVFVLSSFAYSQIATTAVLVDEFGEECVESVLAHRDSFFNTLGQERGSHGAIILYGRTGLEGRNRKLIGYYSNFDTLAQKYPGSTIKVIRGPNRNTLKVQFWKVPQGAPDPVPDG